MKKLVVSKENPCMACLSCVRACSEAFYKTFDQDKSCIQITEKNGAIKVTCGHAEEGHTLETTAAGGGAGGGE